MTQPDSKYLLWKTYQKTIMQQRIPDGQDISATEECKAATIYSRRKYKYWEGEPKWGRVQ
jgi:hypothetical protein